MTEYSRPTDLNSKIQYVSVRMALHSTIKLKLIKTALSQFLLISFL